MNHQHFRVLFGFVAALGVVRAGVYVGGRNIVGGNIVMVFVKLEVVDALVLICVFPFFNILQAVVRVHVRPLFRGFRFACRGDVSRFRQLVPRGSFGIDDAACRFACKNGRARPVFRRRNDGRGFFFRIEFERTVFDAGRIRRLIGRDFRLIYLGIVLFRACGKYARRRGREKRREKESEQFVFACIFSHNIAPLHK